MTNIKEKLAKLLFPELVRDKNLYYKHYENAVKYNSKFNQYKSEFDRLLKYISSANNLVKKGYIFLGIEEDKNGMKVLIYMHQQGNSYNIYIDYLTVLDTINYLKMYVNYNEQSNSFFIHDIQISEQNCNNGYGSLAMEKLLLIAKIKGISFINGEISPVDWDHIDRLKHFYEKHNFEVMLNYESKRGNIKWQNKKKN